MGYVFCALPRFKPVGWLGAWPAHSLRWDMHLMHLPSPDHWVSWVCCKGTIPGVLCVSSGSWSQAVTLLAAVNHPGSQGDVISSWRPSHSLLENVVSGAEIVAAAWLLALAVAHLPLPPGRALNGIQLTLLWYSPGHNPLFCEHTRGHHAALESFNGKGLGFLSFLFFVSLAIPLFGLLCHLSPLRFSSGHSRPVLTLRTNDAAHASLPSPPSLLVDVSGWATSLLIVAIRHIFCACFSQLCCPLRFQSTPQTHLWEGFLLCGNFSSMTPSPGQAFIPKSFVSVFIFYNLYYLLLKRLGCLFGCLVSPTSVQKLFCESCSTFE